MSLLTDEEMEALFKAHYDKNQCIDTLLLAFEAAILAKLASAELPEPEYMPLLLIGAKHSSENVGERSFTEAEFFSAAREIFKLGQSQAYAQGAAAQLAEMPVAELMWDEEKHKSYMQYVIPLSLLPEGTQLYTPRQA